MHGIIADGRRTGDATTELPPDSPGALSVYRFWSCDERPVWACALPQRAELAEAASDDAPNRTTAPTSPAAGVQASPCDTPRHRLGSIDLLFPSRSSSAKPSLGLWPAPAAPFPSRSRGGVKPAGKWWSR
jgi:hypothetical protein